MQRKSEKSTTSSGHRPAGVRKVRIDADFADQRIDNFLRRELSGVPKSRIYRCLRRGEVRVNGGRVRAEYRLKAGDEVRIPPVRVREAAAMPLPEGGEKLLQRVIFEDGRLLVVNKPSGLAVHGGSGISHGVIELMRVARPELAHLSLVHRLDRETSGVLVLAKKRSALRSLHALFRDRLVEKNYMALVCGDWQHGDVTIKAPLEVQNRRRGERHVVVSETGSRAQTRIRLLDRFGVGSLVQCQPRTGRTHQIRVHAAHAGHPIAGDDRYGERAANDDWMARGLTRLFLHAQSITFPDEHGNEQHFTAPLGADLDGLLNRLR